VDWHLKVIVREAYVDTNATILHIREQLNSLDLHIVKLVYDIEKFNAKVKTYQKGLAARGVVTTDQQLVQSLQGRIQFGIH
jgi:hypothetical protein